MDAIATLQEHEFVRRHFHQVTSLQIRIPSTPQVEFWALEFRVSNNAALIWTDGQGSWGAGKWLPLPNRDAEITSSSSQLSIEYFQNAANQPTLLAAVDALALSK